ncbi:uncharacterized protein DSM5745_05939 [Aspergillus mulundensis]|uniref:Ankyrin repeat-containing protein n=1 Tax=Aspergillus mulundensis TaxID=1810919 RepID=A0A3D8RYE7_9EURO|nr:hypothetical protein DSM5745_05939 [Aspergillus mulundensis]RDW79087.1 hypothetical protein DSM5745_05939 [Aspergillus mulundensis]
MENMGTWCSMIVARRFLAGFSGLARSDHGLHMAIARHRSTLPSIKLSELALGADGIHSLFDFFCEREFPVLDNFCLENIRDWDGAGDDRRPGFRKEEHSVADSRRITDSGGCSLPLFGILHANCPLGPAELYFAILAGTEPDPDFLADWTAQSVTSSEQGFEVHFIHESVRDFLRGPGLLEVGLESISPGPSHDALKTCCLNYVLKDLSSRFAHTKDIPKADTQEAKLLMASMLQKCPFLKYAVEHILYHANEARELGKPQEAFLTGFPSIEWILKDNVIEYVLAIVKMGHQEAAKILLTIDTFTFGKSSRIMVTGKAYPYGFVASKLGPLDLPRLLAESDYKGFRPLHHAAMDAKESMVRLLIAAGADLEARILLDAGADLEATDYAGGTPLLYAVDVNDNPELDGVAVPDGEESPVISLGPLV